MSKEFGLILGEGRSDGKPVLRITMPIYENADVNVPEQRREVEAILKQCLSIKLADEVMAYVANVRTVEDELSAKKWVEGRYEVYTSGRLGVISIMVYIN